jgi:hypothetical protein
MCHALSACLSNLSIFEASPLSAALGHSELGGPRNRTARLCKNLSELGHRGAISRRNGALYGDGPGTGTDGPFPEEYILSWQ